MMSITSAETARPPPSREQMHPTSLILATDYWVLSIGCRIPRIVSQKRFFIGITIAWETVPRRKSVQVVGLDRGCGWTGPTGF